MACRATRSSPTDHCNAVRALGERAPSNRALQGMTIGNLTEPSTHASFELAGRAPATVLGRGAAVLAGHGGDHARYDLHAESVHLGFVIRDAEPGVIAHVAAHVARTYVSVFGGRASVDPTWWTADVLTVRSTRGERFESCAPSSATSVTARRPSAYAAFTVLGIGELRSVAPRPR